MKKIGIITMQKSPASYGATFQELALFKYIEYLGYDCQIIDLLRFCHKGYINSVKRIHVFPKQILKQKVSKRSKLILLIYKIINPSITYNNYKRKLNFRKMHSLINYSKAYYSIDDFYNNPPIYDLYITGSDQIWNPNMLMETEPYFLTFTKNKMSYASSFGLSKLPDYVKEWYKKWLKEFKIISVREKNGAEIIKKLINSESPVVLDPTFLLSSNFWTNFAVNTSIKKKYAVSFFLHNNKELTDKIYDFCKKQHLELVMFNTKYPFSKIDYYDASYSGPLEWLGFINQADIIFTDSFHATVFSIIFRKNFYSFITASKVGGRIVDLLEQFNLSDRIKGIEDKLQNEFLIKQIDWKNIENSINDEITKSQLFLKESINKLIK